jgi:hypothetical protein
VNKIASMVNIGRGIDDLERVIKRNLGARVPRVQSFE